MAFSKSLPKEQIPVGCQLCEGGTKIEWKCIDCNFLMCVRCKDRVHLRIAKDHRIVNIKEIGGGEDSWDKFVFSDMKCQDHPNQPCSLYCRSCCKVICFKCIVKVHNGHTFVDDEEFNDKKGVLKKGQEEVERHLGKLNSEKEKKMADDEPKNLELKQLKQNITDHKRKLYKAVDQFADNLVQDVNRRFGNLQSKDKTKIDKRIKQMNAKKEILDKIITSKDFIKFFTDFDKLNISLDENISQETMNNSSLPKFVPSEFTVLNFGKLEGSTISRERDVPLEFKVRNEWITELDNIHYLIKSSDGTLWVADNVNELLLHIKLEKDNVTVLSTFNLVIYGIESISPSNILISIGETRLKLINGITQTVTDTVFDIAPLISRDFHITKDQQILLAARSPGPAFPVTGRRIVVLMDQEGNHLIEYEHDSSHTRLFSLPYAVSGNSLENFCIVDSLNVDGRGRVVVIDYGGNPLGFYTGHHDLKIEDKPFTPQCVIATPLDNFVISDYKNHGIHILNSDGDFLSYYRIQDIGIKLPYSLALHTPGELYIGCVSTTDDALLGGAKIFEIEYSGI